MADPEGYKSLSTNAILKGEVFWEFGVVYLSKTLKGKEMRVLMFEH